jgi:tyrosyl-tRNA synthetase
MNDFLTIMQERGFVHQCTDEAGLRAQLMKPSLGYIGFDCTATSFHVGSLLPIMMLKWFQECGHRPIVLMGGGTSMVGDPSGKDESRRILSVEQIEKNKEKLGSVFRRFLRLRDFGDTSPNAGIVLDNADWLQPLRFISFLREVGTHFSVNRMLAMDSVKGRLERQQEMSLLEFNYMVLQAFDFVTLNRRLGCVLQMGGSDQWGNIVNGIDLGRRMETGQLFGLTCPLIETASGDKMGKTAGGAVWLDAEKTSPFDFWQFWRNTDDRDVERFLKLFTMLRLDAIQQIMAGDINDAKIKLADRVTRLVHGDLERVFAGFEEDGTPIPHTLRFSIAELGPGATMANVCVAIGMFPSLSQARKNGWSKPLVTGERHELTKKKIVVEIVE